VLPDSRCGAIVSLANDRYQILSKAGVEPMLSGICREGFESYPPLQLSLEYVDFGSLRCPCGARFLQFFLAFFRDARQFWGLFPIGSGRQGSRK